MGVCQPNTQKGHNFMVGLIAKAIIAAAVSAASAAVTALQNGHIDVQEWIVIALAFVVGLGAVWAVPNLPTGIARYGKAITAAVLAGLSAYATAATTGGWIPSTDELIVIIIALLSGAGLVAAAPNAPVSTNIRPA